MSKNKKQTEQPDAQAWAKAVVIRAICFHENWSQGNHINPMARLGFVEYICLNCGKKIYREPHNPPINRHV